MVLASVIVPTFNRCRMLQRTLNALLEQTLPPDSYEIIVVDDGSSDDSPIMVKRMALSTNRLLYIRHSVNQGRVIARNDGIRAARGQIVILLDDDNVPSPDFVQAHLRLHTQNNDGIAVMGNAQYASEVLGASNLGHFLQSRYLGCRSPEDRIGIDYRDLPPRCFGTLNCSVRRTDLLKVGLFDTDFRYYGGEDEYMGYCLHGLGIRIVFGEDARSCHYDEISVDRYKKKIMEGAREGTKVILSKSPGYFEGTQIRLLLPVDLGHDDLRRVVAKLGVSALLNPLTTFLLELWARRTDRYERLYFRLLYRALLAGWYLQGYRTRSGGARLVQYSEI